MKECPKSDSFILEMEPALRQLIRVRGVAPADQIYMDFIQYQIALNPATGKSRWRDYEFQKYTFGIHFMIRLDSHIDLVLRGAAPAISSIVEPFTGAPPTSLKRQDRVLVDQWKPMAEFIAGRSDASEFERITFSQNLLDTYPGRTISSKQFELLDAFFKKYKQRDEENQYKKPTTEETVRRDTASGMQEVSL